MIRAIIPPHPPWLKVRLQTHQPWLQATRERVASVGLSTVCEEARCPNLSECWAGGAVTLMLMGDLCTRGCRFCAVKTGNPAGWLDVNEPAHVAEMVSKGGWTHVVLTAVNRDDLPDGGAVHIARCIQQIRATVPETRVEVLIPDFQGDLHAFETMLEAAPDVLAHNLETVQRLTPLVRDRRATYEQSLSLLDWFGQHGLVTKSSLMVGLGETTEEVEATLADLRQVGVSLLTLGQYLQPSERHLPVHTFLPPEWFESMGEKAKKSFGFKGCLSGPLVRSSYQAGLLYQQAFLDAAEV